jgi:hypothetical protein
MPAQRQQFLELRMLATISPGFGEFEEETVAFTLRYLYSGLKLNFESYL